MFREVLRSEQIGDLTIRLLKGERGFRVIADSPQGNVHHPALAARWVFRTTEVANLGFEFAVAMERAWKAITANEPCDATLKHLEQTSTAFNAAARKYRDFPPGSAGAEELGIHGPEDDGP